MKILGVLFLVGFLMVLLFSSIEESREQEIRDWITKHGYTVRNMEPKIFDWGPYFLVNTKDVMNVWRVETNEGKIFWFRFWIWSFDVEEYHR